MCKFLIHNDLFSRISINTPICTPNLPWLLNNLNVAQRVQAQAGDADADVLPLVLRVRRRIPALRYPLPGLDAHLGNLRVIVKSY